MIIKKPLLKGIILFFFIFSMAANPADAQAPKAVQNQVKNITISILNKDWHKAYKQTTNFRKYFDKNKWKFQLMGDEVEYESISNDIENLKAALIAKDRTQALIIASDIKEIFNQIFEL